VPVSQERPGDLNRLLMEILDLGETDRACARQRALAGICRGLEVDVLYTVIPGEGGWVKSAVGPDGGLGTQTAAHLTGVARHVLSRRSRFLETRVQAHGGFHRHQDGWPGLDVGSYIALPIHRRGKCHGVLVLLRSAERPSFRTEDLVAAELLGDALAISEANDQRLAEVERLARTDAATTLPNQRELREILRRALLRTARLGLPLSLLLIEVDPGARVALRRGRAAADARLREVAGALARSIRGSDHLTHYCGSALALVLPETPRDGALVLVARLKQALARMMSDLGLGEDCACSWGVASAPDDGTDVARLLHAAAEALHVDLREMLAGPAGGVTETPAPAGKTVVAPLPHAGASAGRPVSSPTDGAAASPGGLAA